MTTRALCFSAVLLGAQALAFAKPAAECNAAGKWVLKLTRTAGTCSSPAMKSDVLEVFRAGSGYALSYSNYDDDHEQERPKLSIEDVGGSCILKLDWDYNIIAKGTPDFVRLSYRLTERNGQISGKLESSDLGRDPLPGSDELPVVCTDSYQVTGFKKK